MIVCATEMIVPVDSFKVWDDRVLYWWWFAQCKHELIVLNDSVKSLALSWFSRFQAGVFHFLKASEEATIWRSGREEPHLCCNRLAFSSPYCTTVPHIYSWRWFINALALTAMMHYCYCYSSNSLRFLQLFKIFTHPTEPQITTTWWIIHPSTFSTTLQHPSDIFVIPAPLRILLLN